MVSVLKKKGRKNTISGTLLYYTRDVLLIVAFLIAGCIGAWSMQDFASMRENQMKYQINQFYIGLQETENFLYSVVSGQDISDYSELRQFSSALTGALQEIAEFQVSVRFSRDIADLEAILEAYQTRINLILEYMLAGETYSLVSETYYEAEHMYELMNGTFLSVYSQAEEALLQYERQTRRNSLIYLVILAGTISLLIWYMVLRIRGIERNIVHPVQRLMEALEDIDLNCFAQAECISEDGEPNDDIRFLIHAYNSMLEKIKAQLLEREEYVNTRIKLQEQEVLNLQISNELKKSQLLNLQTQINPHFLFNTLNMISHTAYLEGDRTTVTLLEAASDFLRYALDYSDKAVSLEMEMENLRNYVYLQEQRFGKRIAFRFDLDDSFFAIRMPNLILQPLVENAITHGVGMYTQGGEITILTEYLPETKTGRIRIIDNGEGMDEETLAAVDAQMRSRKENTGKIGLSNVFFRLSIFFEQRADILLQSIPHKRTEIILLLPCDDLKMGEDACIKS